MSALDQISDALPWLVQNVWGAACAPDEPLQETPAEGERPYSAWIEIRGAWNGTLRVECDPLVALHAAVGLFGGNPVTIGESEMLDALRELVNLIGGNAKAVIAPGCRLGLPEAELGSPPAALPKDRPACVSDLSWRGKPLRVCVFESD